MVTLPDAPPRDLNPPLAWQNAGFYVESTVYLLVAAWFGLIALLGTETELLEPAIVFACADIAVVWLAIMLSSHAVDRHGSKRKASVKRLLLIVGFFASVTTMFVLMQAPQLWWLPIVVAVQGVRSAWIALTDARAGTRLYCSLIGGVLAAAIYFAHGDPLVPVAFYFGVVGIAILPPMTIMLKGLIGDEENTRSQRRTRRLVPSDEAKSVELAGEEDEQSDDDYDDADEVVEPAASARNGVIDGWVKQRDKDAVVLIYRRSARFRILTTAAYFALAFLPGLLMMPHPMSVFFFCVGALGLPQVLTARVELELHRDHLRLRFRGATPTSYDMRFPYREIKSLDRRERSCGDLMIFDKVPIVAVHHRTGVAELPMLLHPRGAAWLTAAIKLMRKGRTQVVYNHAKRFATGGGMEIPGVI